MFKEPEMLNSALFKIYKSPYNLCIHASREEIIIEIERDGMKEKLCALEYNFSNRIESIAKVEKILRNALKLGKAQEGEENPSTQQILTEDLIEKISIRLMSNNEVQSSQCTV